MGHKKNITFVCKVCGWEPLEESIEVSYEICAEDLSGYICPLCLSSYIYSDLTGNMILLRKRDGSYM